MGFGLDFNATSDYDVVPAGVYECIITNAGVKDLDSGKQKISFTLTIRNDVEQQCQNRTLWLDVWKKHEPNAADMSIGGFNFSQLMGIAKHAKMQDGKKYENLEDFLADMIDKLLRVKVTHTESGGNTYANIDGFKGVTFSKYPECKHKKKENTSADGFASKSDGFASGGGELGDFVEILGDDVIPF